MSTEKKEKLLTPVGFAKYAWVHIPQKSFDEKGKPKFKIDVAFDPKDPEWAKFAQAIKDELLALPVQMNKKTDPPSPMPKQSPIKRELDVHDQPTGRLIASFKTGEEFPPGVFDKYKNRIPKETLIGNESKVRVAYSKNVYDGFGGGINFYLGAVQVMELVPYENRTADSYGFDGEEQPATSAANQSQDETLPF